MSGKLTKQRRLELLEMLVSAAGEFHFDRFFIVNDPETGSWSSMFNGPNPLCICRCESPEDCLDRTLTSLNFSDQHVESVRTEAMERLLKRFAKIGTDIDPGKLATMQKSALKLIEGNDP